MLRHNVLLIASALLISANARADLSSSGSINVNNIQITISTAGFGSVLNLVDSAFAFAEDSLGGNASNFDLSPDDPATTGLLATTTLASSTSSASVNNLALSASGGVIIPGTLSATADTSSSGALFGLWELVDLSNPTATESVSVDVNASASLSYIQNLSTSVVGQQATSEVQFQLNLPDVQTSPFLSFDSLQTIGPNTTQSVTAGPQQLTASASAVSLLTDTPYLLDITAEADTSGINNVTPEPGYSMLLGAGLACLFAIRIMRPRRIA